MEWRRELMSRKAKANKEAWLNAFAPRSAAALPFHPPGKSGYAAGKAGAPARHT